ncbi:hypothetical protein ACCAA_1630003 [Candidatus Accumulibacter aalborgensis]|uniref:Uncharacterized protein n=1 Tax=Candidatus Accumulibacter aalborgensis TaxID=1860102 RepID=A0A1A8XHF3_9PROT|nr:hypothetical protein ACCAA_1630003 [Candidatus Accumulibacter aalborgensis]
MFSHNFYSDYETAHVDDIFGVEHDAKLVFKGRDQGHMRDGVPRLDGRVQELVIDKFLGKAEGLGEYAADSFYAHEY